MKTTYFKNCSTIEDVKKTYRDLAKKLHPDCGGNAEEFKKMSEEYTEAFKMYRNKHRSSTAEEYEKETTETPEQFADIINIVIKLEGIKIEIIGSWIWISGNTYPHREILKNNGFRWSKSKKSWYNAGEELQGKRRGHYTMEGLRDKWGTEEIKTKPNKLLSA